MATYRIKLNEVRPDLAPHLEKSLESVPGVRGVTIEVGSSCAIIEHDNANRDEVAAALREEGFEPRFE